MGLFEWFKKKKNDGKPLFTEEELKDVGVCPNCWGKQDYDGQFLEVIEDRQVDANNKYANTRKALIQEFVENHVDGIWLKKDGEQMKCPMCEGKYKTVHHKV